LRSLILHVIVECIDLSEECVARFVFHIGWPETGATNVQACFDLNKDAFQRAGILYPRFARSRGTHLSLAPHLFGLAGNARRIVPVDPEAIYPSLMQEAEAARCSTIFLSSERFCQARTFNATLLDPFRRHEVVVAACLRRQD
jgi:hypothetical protein